MQKLEIQCGAYAIYKGVVDMSGRIGIDEHAIDRYIVVVAGRVRKREPILYKRLHNYVFIYWYGKANFYIAVVKCAIFLTRISNIVKAETRSEVNSYIPVRQFVNRQRLRERKVKIESRVGIDITVYRQCRMRNHVIGTTYIQLLSLLSIVCPVVNIPAGEGKFVDIIGIA